MADTKIEWCDKVWNPVTGCTKVSQGCKNCYAERIFGRNLPEMKGQKFTDVVCHADRLAAPLHWRKPARIFVNSMSDLFHEQVPSEFIARVLAVAGDCPQHTFMVLTKRPKRMQAILSDICSVGCCKPPKNLWLGVSVEDQKAADERIPLLLQTPAAVRFISAEPLLGLIKLDHRWLPSHITPPIFSKRHSGFHNQPNGGLGWVICGGESGPNARPMHPDWARSLRDQCQAAGVPFFFKQWGEFSPYYEAVDEESRSIVTREYANGNVRRVGKQKAGRLLEGREWNEFPEVQR